MKGTTFTNPFYTSTVSLFVKGEGSIERGVYKEGELVICEENCPCDVQPISAEQFYSEYGYKIEVDYKIYLSTPSLYEVTPLHYAKINEGEEVYRVVEVQKWSTYSILFIKRFVG